MLCFRIIHVSSYIEESRLKASGLMSSTEAWQKLAAAIKARWWKRNNVLLSNDSQPARLLARRKYEKIIKIMTRLEALRLLSTSRWSRHSEIIKNLSFSRHQSCMQSSWNGKASIISCFMSCMTLAGHYLLIKCTLLTSFTGSRKGGRVPMYRVLIY